MLNLSKRKNLIKLGIGLIALTALILLFEPKKIAGLLLNVNYIYVLFTILICSAVLIIRIYRWKLILHEMKIKSSFWKLGEIYLISSFFNTFLPSSIGGDIYRIYDLCKISSKKIRPVITVLIERITGVLALISIGIFSLIVYSDILEISQKAIISLVAILLIVIFLVISAICYFEKIYYLIRQIIPSKYKDIASEEKIKKIADVVVEIKENKKLLFNAYLLGIILQFCVIAAFYTTSLALNNKIPMNIFLMFVPMVEIISLIPISINGLGLRDGSLLYFLSTVSISPSFSMSLSILLRLILLVFALIGGFLLVFKRLSVLK